MFKSTAVVQRINENKNSKKLSKSGLLSGCCLIAVDLLCTKRWPHFTEGLKKVTVFKG